MGVEKWQKFGDACEAFHRSGGGLFVLADNMPFYTHANVILERISNAELEGVTPGNQILKLGDAQFPSSFSSHLITTGITGELYEGDTVCYPKSLGSLQPLAQSSNGKPVILYQEASGNNGRVVVDTGFTKLWLKFNTAGTSRYVRNVAVWLLGIDYRLKHGKAVKVN